MPIVFTKSPMASALEQGAYLLIALLVGLVFGSLFFLLDDMAMTVMIASGLACLISAWMSVKLIGEAISILKTGRAWRVEITSNSLVWDSPVQKIMKSFEVRLADVKQTRFLLTTYRASKRSPTRAYFIDLKNGDSIKLDPQRSGIHPPKIFKALEGKAIPFVKETERVGNKVAISVS